MHRLCLGVIVVTGHFTKKATVRRLEGDGELFSFLILGGCFFLGLLSGLLFASFGEASSELSAYLQNYFQSVSLEEGWRPAIWTVIWDLTQWPLAALVFGFTALGVICVPALLLARGFLLSYAVSLFLRLFGGSGMLAALVAFGIPALLVIPALFAISCDAFRSSLGRVGAYGDHPVFSLRQKVVTLVPSAGLLILAAILQWTVMPALLSTICTRLFAF